MEVKQKVGYREALQNGAFGELPEKDSNLH
jgi:hypothetical protein